MDKLLRLGSAEEGKQKTRVEAPATDTFIDELIEAGAWRQLSLFEHSSGWNESVCAELRGTRARGERGPTRGRDPPHEREGTPHEREGPAPPREGGTPP